MADANEWEHLGSADLSGGAADDVDVTGLDIKKLLQVLMLTTSTGSSVDMKIRFNADVGSLYARRRSLDGASDVTNVSQDSIDIEVGGFDVKFAVMDVVNINGEEKLAIIHVVEGGSTGAGNAPSRVEVVGKYVPSPLTDDIDEVNLHNGAAGTYDTESSVDVAGAD